MTFYNNFDQNYIKYTKAGRGILISEFSSTGKACGDKIDGANKNQSGSFSLRSDPFGFESPQINITPTPTA